MSFENPSAAFLAGQQHGAQLAVQHATKPPVAAPKPKPAAPTRKPAATKPAGNAGDTLLAQAQKIAQAQTQQIVNAILGQQKVYQGQGVQQATDIHNAAQAAAQLLQNWNLPGLTSSSYTDAAKALGALASGFSGQTATDAKAAADQAAANLGTLGAPAGGLKTSTGQTVQPDATANVLYGLGGFIPGNLLETSGQAAAAQERTLPLNLLAQAQDKAAGAIQAANDKAQTLTPQILDAQGKLPQLASSIYNDMFNQRVTLQKLADAEAATKFDQKFKVNSFNATQAYRQATLQLKQQGLALQSAKAQAALQQQIANGAKPNAALSKIYGHIVDSNGNTIAGADGKPIPVRSTTGKSSALSAAKINQLTGDAALIASNTLNGFTDAKGNKHPALNFGQALAEMRKGTGHGTIPIAIAIQQMRQAGWKIPAKYRKIAGGSPDQGSPFLPGNTGTVNVAPNANRAGTSISPLVTDFVARVAGLAGTALTIGTGTNHNEHVVGTDRVSDHWDGHAADIPASGSQLTQLGQDALIAAGMPPALARQKTGGLFNINVGGHRVQIIFNSMEGGNHYNHLHVGVR